MKNFLLLFLCVIPFLGCDQSNSLPVPDIDGKYLQYGVRISLNNKIVGDGFAGVYVSQMLELKSGHFILGYKSDNSSESGTALGRYKLVKTSIYDQYKMVLTVDESTTSVYPSGKELEYTDVTVLSDEFSMPFSYSSIFTGPGLTYYYSQQDTFDIDKDYIFEEDITTQVLYKRIN